MNTKKVSALTYVDEETIWWAKAETTTTHNLYIFLFIYKIFLYIG